MVAVRWSNGQIDTARSWSELLQVVRKTQWSLLPENEFRYMLAKRAWRWSLTPVDPDAPPHRFFKQLERARLVEILADPTEFDERKI